MATQFLVYLRLGFEHIADLAAYDHLLFVTALCVVYPLRAWRSLLVLVTAFTVGHSITLALATLDLFRPNIAIIEFLIPVTIVLASIVNIAEAARGGQGASAKELAQRIKYGSALVFGLIHGLGFSAFLRAALGTEEQIVWPLFAFNLGLEVGQLAIVVVVLTLGALVVRFSRLNRSAWMLVVSGGTAGIALTLILDQLIG